MKTTSGEFLEPKAKEVKEVKEVEQEARSLRGLGFCGVEVYPGAMERLVSKNKGNK